MRWAGRPHRMGRNCWCRPSYIPATPRGMDGALVVAHHRRGHDPEGRARAISRAILEIVREESREE